jgi:hypothetical protein
MPKHLVIISVWPAGPDQPQTVGFGVSRRAIASSGVVFAILLILTGFVVTTDFPSWPIAWLGAAFPLGLIMQAGHPKSSYQYYLLDHTAQPIGPLGKSPPPFLTGRKSMRVSVFRKQQQANDKDNH